MNSKEKREDMIANLIIIVICTAMVAGMVGGITFLVQWIASFFN